MKYRLIAEIVLLVLLAPWIILSLGMYANFVTEALR